MKFIIKIPNSTELVPDMLTDGLTEVICAYYPNATIQPLIVSQCMGYPNCDGDLVGEDREEYCPEFKGTSSSITQTPTHLGHHIGPTVSSSEIGLFKKEATNLEVEE